MKQASNDLTRGSIAPQMLRFSLPLMCSNVLQVLFNASDLAIVGRFASAAALGSVGSTSAIVMLITGFLIGLGSGVNVLVAQFFGAKQQRDLSETVHTSAIVCFAMGVLLLVVGLFLAEPLLLLLRTKEDLLDGAVLYLRIYFLAMPAMGLYNFGSAVLSAVGDTRRPLLFLSIAGVINIVLNAFFVIVCGMDVDGVAIASVISQYISAGLIVIALLRSRDVYGMKFAALRLTRSKSLRILAIGLPAGFQYSVFAISNFFIRAGMNTFDSVLIQGDAAASNADTIVYEMMMAFHIACSSFIGQNYGAHQKKRILRSYFISLAFAGGLGAFAGLLLFRYGATFLSLFTTDPAVVEAGLLRMHVMSLSFVLAAGIDNGVSAARGLGKSAVPTVIEFFGICLFRIVWIYTVFAAIRTPLSLYLIYPVSWAITATVVTVYFFVCYKRQTAGWDN